MKRRDLLYHREGYSSEEPPRDMPVGPGAGNFDPIGKMSPHPDAGEVIASHLTFVLGPVRQDEADRHQEADRRVLRPDVRERPPGPDTGERRIEHHGRRDRPGGLRYLRRVLMKAAATSPSSARSWITRRGSSSASSPSPSRARRACPRFALRAAKRIYDMIPFTRPGAQAEGRRHPRQHGAVRRRDDGETVWSYTSSRTAARATSSKRRYSSP